MNNREVEALCGIPKDWNFMWVIDEFDSSFDTLAMASLRYHMDYAVTLCEGERRETYQSLLEEFEEINERNTFTREHREHFDTHDSKDVIAFLNRRCDICDEFMDKLDAMEDKRDSDRKAARHKFIDIMPGLWS